MALEPLFKYTVDMEIDVLGICRSFGFEKDPVKIEGINVGHINATYHLWFDEGEFILQRVNTSIFTKPEEMMDNIELILKEMPVLFLKKTKDGRTWVRNESGFWRIMNFVGNSMSYQKMTTPEQAYKMGSAMKEFHNTLKKVDASKLYETLPDFHNMIWRYENFDKAIEFNYGNRVETCRREVEYLLENRERGSVISRLYNSGKLRKWVTHNDTKLNNVLFDRDTGNYLTFIDLDTIMPGTVLFDVGDMIRTSCSTADEDEKDLGKVSFSIDFYNALMKGYLDDNDGLDELERALIPECGRTLTQIMAVRFLTDYLNGDTYYHIDYPDHNLVRTRTQVKQMQEMDRYFKEPDFSSMPL